MTTVLNLTSAKIIAVHAALADAYPAVIAGLLELSIDPRTICGIIRVTSAETGIAPELVDNEEFSETKAMSQIAFAIGEAAGLDADEIGMGCELTPSQSDAWDAIGVMLVREYEA
jgi:hypothetical protein